MGEVSLSYGWKQSKRQTGKDLVRKLLNLNACFRLWFLGFASTDSSFADYSTLEMTGPFFLNFDVAILCSKAQHLLALARKVEQGGLNG